MPIHTIVGPAARGENFYKRPKLIENIWRVIDSGSHVLLVAPRRVGKTSVLFFLEDNPRQNIHPIYLITESVNNENEFFRKLYTCIFELLDGAQKFAQRIKNLIGKNQITEITKSGIKLQSGELNYYNSLVKLFDLLDLESEKLLIMIDEFPETVENIIRDEGEANAVSFLQKNRELRHSPAIKEKVRFLLAGSIGLENVVAKINASSAIDDLHSFRLPPFSRKEATGLVFEKILRDSDMELTKELADYILNKIEWLIPFYIQLIMDEIYKLYTFEELTEVTETTIERAFDNAIQHQLYFNLWLTRLKTAYKGKDFNFVKNLLNHAAEQGAVSSAEIYNFAVQFKVEKDFKSMINTLVYDGYINNNDDPKIYRFNSPILKRWWFKYVAN